MRRRSGRLSGTIRTLRDSFVPTDSGGSAAAEPVTVPTLEVTQLEGGLSVIRFEGDSGFDKFLSQGGAASDSEVAGYLTSLVKENISLGDLLFGCSAISVPSTEGGCLFGRNFDWEPCHAMIVQSAPESGYKSISTVIRLLLDKAATVDEALDLLGQHDMHASMGYMMHLAIADNRGRSVAAEWVSDQMIVVETPVVTSFYLAGGEKNGIGTAQSHERYDILMDTLGTHKTMNQEEVRDALDSVSKDNFGEFESTEWSVVFDQGNLTARYYHRENYAENYTFQLD